MHRWVIMTALMLTMGTALPAWADDAADCGPAMLNTSPDRALSACRRLADQGDAQGQTNLGVMYYSGQGVPQDYVQAYMWFNLSAAQGGTDADKQRDAVASKMTPSQIEKARALAAAWRPTTGQ
jgi:TPR repeat protein